MMLKLKKYLRIAVELIETEGKGKRLKREEGVKES